jgi:stage IV sporulation protein FB
LVNFVLAIVLAVVGVGLGYGMEVLGPAALMDQMGTLSLRSIFNYVFVSNLFLGIFNLIPAFPMDGGRVLRALLAIPLNYVTATRIAAAIGQTLAFVFGFWGFTGGGFFVILLAIFVYMGAGQESQMVQIRQALRGLLVAQAYSRQARTLSPQATLQDAVDLILSTFQADFPVCEGERLVGLLPQTRLLEQLHKHGPTTPVSEVMLTDVTPVEPGDEVFAVQQRLSGSQLDALPVVEGGRFLGLITSRDISELYRLISIEPNLLERIRA